MNQYISRVSTSILVLFLACSFAVASTPQGTFEKTFQVNGPVELEVRSRSGDITVRSGGSGAVTVRGKIFVSDRWLFGNRHADVSDIEQHPPLRQDGNNIHIEYVNARDISVDYEVTVPANTTIRTHSGSGDQIIEGTHGNADLHSGSGNITARGVRGAFRADAGSGDITAEGTQTGTWTVRTGSGNVHVRLPANAAFDADISTSSGTLDLDAPITMTVQGRVQESHKSIQGKVRGGGPLLSLRTGSGDIHIE